MEPNTGMSFSPDGQLAELIVIQAASDMDGKRQVVFQWLCSVYPLIQPLRMKIKILRLPRFGSHFSKFRKPASGLKLPTEIWELICHFLGSKELWNLRGVNRTLRSFALQRCYASVHIENGPHLLSLLVALSHQHIAGRVQHLHLCTAANIPHHLRNRRAPNQVARYPKLNFLQQRRAQHLHYHIKDLLFRLPLELPSLCLEYSDLPPSPYHSIAWKNCAIYVVHLELRIGEMGCMYIPTLSSPLYLPNVRHLKLAFRPNGTSWDSQDQPTDKWINLFLSKLHGLIPCTKLETLEIGLWDLSQPYLEATRHHWQEGYLNPFNQLRKITFRSTHATQPLLLFQDVRDVVKINLETLTDIRIQDSQHIFSNIGSFTLGTNLEYLQMDGSPFYTHRDKYFPQLAQCCKLKTLYLLGSISPSTELLPDKVLDSFLLDLFASLSGSSQELITLRLPIPPGTYTPPLNIASAWHIFPSLKELYPSNMWLDDSSSPLYRAYPRDAPQA